MKTVKNSEFVREIALVKHPSNAGAHKLFFGTATECDLGHSVFAEATTEALKGRLLHTSGS